MVGAFGAVFLLRKFAFRQHGKIRYKGFNNVFDSRLIINESK